MELPDSLWDLRLERIDLAPLSGRRPRAAGKNARLDEHGLDVSFHAARVQIGGLEGWGWSPIPEDAARSLCGRPAAEVFDPKSIIRPYFWALQFPLLDWLGRYLGSPVFRLFNPSLPPDSPFPVPCYDTSLYLDDLGLDDRAACELMMSETAEGVARGHTAFKVKIGRGGRHMPLEDGMRRDADVVRAVREAAGPDAVVMLDANNGLNLNLAKRLLDDVAEARPFWLEEAFHEDDVLYADLKEWMAGRGYGVLVADGEGAAHPDLLRWAERGLVDVIQYDVRGYGFMEWVNLGRRLDAMGVYSAPHQYGGMYGNYVAPHLAGVVERFAFAEWDEAEVDGVSAEGYRIEDGKVLVPPSPGFGLEFDGSWFASRVAEAGWSAHSDGGGSP